MNKISDFGFVVIYVLSISFSGLLISLDNNLVDEYEFGLIIPESCTSSSQFSDEYSCEKLFDGLTSVWSDNSNACNDETWIEFYFNREYFIEFIVLRNPESPEWFYTSHKIKNFMIQTTNGTVLTKMLENDDIQQWLDINEYISELKIEILDTYPSEKYGTYPATKDCVLMEVNFYGRIKSSF